MMDVATDVHAEYFLRQQAAERDFLAQVGSHLCNSREAATDELAYQAALHSLLVPLRAAITRHTHAAFYIKDICLLSAHETKQIKGKRDHAPQPPVVRVAFDGAAPVTSAQPCTTNTTCGGALSFGTRRYFPP